MRDIATKTNGTTTLDAGDFNADQAELENIVTSADISFDPAGGPDTNLNMLGQAVSGYANAGATYGVGGTGDAITLSISSNLKSPTKYYKNMTVFFKVSSANTVTNPTVNVNGLGAITITRPDASALSIGDLKVNYYVTLVYNDSLTTFELIDAYSILGKKDEGVIIKRASSTTIDIDATTITVYDSAGRSRVVGSISSLIDLTLDESNSSAGAGSNGILGLDTGDWAVGWYYLYIIHNGSSVSCVASLARNWIGTTNTGTATSTDGVLKTNISGYSHGRLVGTVYCSSISPTVFDKFHQNGNVVAGLFNNVNVLTTSGNVTTATAAPPIAATLVGSINPTIVSGTYAAGRLFTDSSTTIGQASSSIYAGGNGANVLEVISDFEIPIIKGSNTLYYVYDAGGGANHFIRFTGYTHDIF